MRSTDVNTCPKCGALIHPNLARCRQCKHYLHGTQVEGFIFEHLLPGRLAAAPGTGIFFLMIVGYYALMVMFAGLTSALGFTSFSLQQLGSTWSLGIYEGQYWRFVTSVLAHGGIIHLAFNLYALTIVGPLIEQVFDRKKMMVIFCVAGIGSMIISHYFYTEVMGDVVRSSVGASGAVSGLIGACFVAAKRAGPEGRPIAQVMLRWTIYMAIFGFAMGGIDNAAHAGGWVLGAGLAAVIPLGITQTVAAQRALSVVILGFLGLFVVSVALMLAHLKGYPASLDNDAHPQRVFFFTISEGADPQFSSQRKAQERCEDAVLDLGHGAEVTEEKIHDCELAIRAFPRKWPDMYRNLILLHERAGNTERAEELSGVIRELDRLLRRR